MIYWEVPIKVFYFGGGCQFGYSLQFMFFGGWWGGGRGAGELYLGLVFVVSLSTCGCWYVSTYGCWYVNGTVFVRTGKL